MLLCVRIKGQSGREIACTSSLSTGTSTAQQRLAVLYNKTGAIFSFKYLTATKFRFFKQDKQDEETMEGMNMSMSGSAEGGAMETMAMPEFPDTSDAIWWFRTMPGRTVGFLCCVVFV